MEDNRGPYCINPPFGSSSGGMTTAEHVREVLRLTGLEKMIEICEAPTKTMAGASGDAQVYVGKDEVPALG